MKTSFVSSEYFYRKFCSTYVYVSVCSLAQTPLVINMFALYSWRGGEIFFVYALWITIAGSSAEGAAVKKGVWIMTTMHHCACV